MQISPRRLPPSSALFLDYLDNWPNIQSFYSEEYSLDSIAKFAERRSRPAHTDRLCAALYEQQTHFGAGRTGVEKLAAGAVAVVTGQQPGLFTGPHLTILKALSVVKIARTLERSGVRAVPVFWIAAEDHDHEEIETTWLLNRDSRLCRARVDLSDDGPTPVGWTCYREDIRKVVDDSMLCLPLSEFAAEVRDMLESCYQPRKSPVECFGLMMAKIFAGTDLTFVDPLHPELKKLAQPLMTEATRLNPEIRAALLKRGKALADAGYHQQVKVDEKYTGLFALRGRRREVLKPNEIDSALSVSPNALLRPVVQDFLFPTAAYVGGPAEVAYFAQASAVYEILRCPMPPIVPRISATIVDAHVERSMKKYGIEFSDVLQGQDFLKEKSVAASHDVDVFSRVRRSVEEELESLRVMLGSVDGTLPRALDTSQRKAVYQVESLRRRFIQAAARRDEILRRHLDSIGNSLFPEKKLQERMLNVTSFLARYGIGTIRRLDESLSLDSQHHQVVTI